MSKDSYAGHFSGQNVPFGIASSAEHPEPQPVTRFQNIIIFLKDLVKSGLFSGVPNLPSEALGSPTLNSFAALATTVHRAVRRTIQKLYHEQGLGGFPELSKEDMSQTTMHLPVEIRDFTDTSCSLSHVRNAGRIITKSDVIPLSFLHFPLAYQGRTASIVPNGTPIERPWGHFTRPRSSKAVETADEPDIVYGPSAKVDYEVELAAVVGKCSSMRQRLTPVQAEEHVFGFVLLNDWSARDIQGFEMTPLGPFNGKSMGTSISSWIVTMDALEPFKTPAPRNDIPESSPLYSHKPSTYSITLDVEIIVGEKATRTGRCSIPSLHWTPQQMVAHTTGSGSALRTGDLIATGTVSGDALGSHGCLLEVTEGGARPLALKDGSHRTFLEDGDVVRITGFAGEPDSGVGFGECVGELVGHGSAHGL